MPMYQFRCTNKDCNHEFEKIVNVPAELWKWCTTCDKLTTWIKDDRQHGLVCSTCTVNKNSTTGSANVHNEDEATDNRLSSEVSICSSCGHVANHVLKVEQRGRDDVSRSSIRFHFNYLAPDV